MPEPEAAPAPGAKYSLPVIAFVLSVLGACTCVTSVVGFVLGIVALLRINREPGLPGKVLAIAAIVIPVALLPFQVGLASAIAIPNLIRFQARAKQAECKVNLREVWTKQVAFRAQTGKWATSFAEIEFAPSPGNRYAYLLAEREVLPVDTRYSSPSGGATHVDELRRRGMAVGVHGDDFTVACIGNIDNDPTLDIWTLSSADRTDASGATVPAGTPLNEVNDVVE